MNLLRYLRRECIQLDLATSASETPADEAPEQRRNRLNREKEAVVDEIADILDRSGEVVNRSKFAKDLLNRERKATTAIAPGVAIPHVRTMQVRRFIMGFARAPGDGVAFQSLDGEPTKLFFLLASPPYDDRTYLGVYRELSELIQDDTSHARLLAAVSDQDVFMVFRGIFTR